jgi:hypothetical protein
MVDIISQFEYYKYIQGDTVFEYGELGEKYFIIMEGSVSIKLPKSKTYGIEFH